MWYGILFASGFVVGYFMLRAITRKTSWDSSLLADKLVWYVVIGTVIGARLGHVLLYDWPYYQAHPLEILMIRNGGLASHGGSIGVFIGVFLFVRCNQKYFPGLTFVKLMDLVIIPASFASGCIRLGNFVNQEIIGIESTKPWAVIFAHPSEGVAAVPRHAVQLYEALLYFSTCVILFVVWKIFGKRLKSGMLFGVGLVLLFGVRFFIEYLKLPATMDLDGAGMFAQYLNIPFVLAGVFLICRQRVGQHKTLGQRRLR